MQTIKRKQKNRKHLRCKEIKLRFNYVKDQRFENKLFCSMDSFYWWKKNKISFRKISILIFEMKNYCYDILILVTITIKMNTLEEYNYKCYLIFFVNLLTVYLLCSNLQWSNLKSSPQKFPIYYMKLKWN